MSASRNPACHIGAASELKAFRRFFGVILASSAVILTPNGLARLQDGGVTAAEAPFVMAGHARPFDLEAAWRKIGSLAIETRRHQAPAASTTSPATAALSPRQTPPIIAIALDTALTLPSPDTPHLERQEMPPGQSPLERMGLNSSTPPSLAAAVRLTDEPTAQRETQLLSSHTDQPEPAAGSAPPNAILGQRSTHTDSSSAARLTRRSTNPHLNTRTWRNIVAARERLMARRATLKAAASTSTAASENPFTALNIRTP